MSFLANPPNQPPWFPEGDPKEPKKRNTLLYFYDTYQSYDLIYVGEDRQGAQLGNFSSRVVKVISNEPSSSFPPFPKLGTNKQAQAGDLSLSKPSPLLMIIRSVTGDLTGAEIEINFATKIALNWYRAKKSLKGIRFNNEQDKIYFTSDVNSSVSLGKLRPREDQGVTGTLEDINLPNTSINNRAIVSPALSNPRVLLFDRFPSGNADYIELIRNVIYAYRLSSKKNWLGKDPDLDGTSKVYDLVNWNLATNEKLEFDIEGVLEEDIHLSYYYTTDSTAFHFKRERVSKETPKLIFNSEQKQIAMYSVELEGKEKDVSALESVLADNYLLFSEVEGSTISGDNLDWVITFNTKNTTRFGEQGELVTEWDIVQYTDFFDYLKDAVFWIRANNSINEEFEEDIIQGSFYKFNEEVKQAEEQQYETFIIAKENRDFIIDHLFDLDLDFRDFYTSPDRGDSDQKKIPRYLWRTKKYWLFPWLERKRVGTETQVEIWGVLAGKYTFYQHETQLSYFQRVLEHTWEYFEKDGTVELRFDKMADSLRIKEIHQALEADTYATYTSTSSGEEVARTANLGYYIQRIARWLGIHVLADGKPYLPKPKQSKVPEPGESSTTLPIPYLLETPGEADDNLDGPLGSFRLDFNFLETSFSDVTDAPLDEARFDGIAYQNVSNRFIEDPTTGEATKVAPSGFTLCHNLPQLLQAKMDDLDKCLGLQEASAFGLQAPESSWASGEDDRGICTYEGLHQLVAENTMMLSAISQQTGKSAISSQISEAILKQIMAIFGLPIQPQNFKVTVGQKANGEPREAPLWYPAFAASSPTVMELWATLLKNIGKIIAEFHGLSPEQISEIQNLSPEEARELINELKE